MGLKYAIFDMDGTLLDSMRAWENLGGDYLASQGVTPPENLLETLKEQTLAESAEYFCNQLGVPGGAAKVLDGINALITREYAETLPLKPFAREYLEQLRARGARMCVATATPRGLAVSALKRLGVWELFDFLIDCDEAGAGKTTPEIYHLAAARLGGTPENTVVYEDALHAAKTAKAAGYQVVGVREPVLAADERELRAVCDRFIGSWKELLEEGKCEACTRC